VEQLRNLNLVDVDARVPRLRAAHHEQPTAERRARHAGQVLHHLERVVVGAGHHAELRLREPHLRHLAAVLHATHDRLVRARLAQHVRHLGALARLHVFGLGEGLEARGGDAHAHGPGRNIHHLEATRVVGERLFVTDEHRRSDDRLARSRRLQPADEVHHGHASVLHDGRFDDLLLHREVRGELNAHRSRLAIDLGGREDELLRGGDGGGIERGPAL
jgi:hypothetical protein